MRADCSAVRVYCVTITCQNIFKVSCYGRLIRAGVSKCGARFETFLRGPTQWCVDIFSGVHGVMIEIGDVTKARPVKVTPRPLQQRLQWTAPVNPINQKLTTLINTSSLARHLTDQKEGTSVVPAERRGIGCCDSGNPESKTLQ